MRDPMLDTLRNEADQIRTERARVLAGLRHDIAKSVERVHQLGEDLDLGRIVGRAVASGHVRVLHPGPPPSMPSFELPEFRDAQTSGTR